MADLGAGGDVGQDRPTSVTTTPKPTARPLPPLSAQTRQVAYGFDTAGRLSSVTDWLGRQSVVAYTADGLLSLTTYANGVTGTSHYDRADRFDAVTYKDPANASLREYGYTLDAAGNRTKVDVTEGGSYSGYEQYVYDALGRMTSARAPDGGTACYAYDANGNRTLVQDACTGSGTAYSYDAADRLTSVGGTLAVGWDANGNRTSVGSDGYAYDWANRMTSATVGGATTTFKYAGDDSRLSKTASSTTTPYIWDRAGGLPMLLDDGSTGLVRANGAVLGEVADTQAGTLTVPLQDALGSVRATTNAAGAVAASAEWDSWGNVRSGGGGLGPSAGPASSATPRPG